MGIILGNNEIGGIIGINQLKYLNKNIVKRNKNHKYFLENINDKFFILILILLVQVIMHLI